MIIYNIILYNIIINLTFFFKNYLNLVNIFLKFSNFYIIYKLNNYIFSFKTFCYLAFFYQYMYFKKFTTNYFSKIF